MAKKLTFPFHTSRGAAARSVISEKEGRNLKASACTCLETLLLQ